MGAPQVRAARKTLSALALGPGLQGSVSGNKVRVSSLIRDLPGGYRQASSSTGDSSPFKSRNVRCGCGHPRSAPVDAAGARRTAAAHKKNKRTSCRSPPTRAPQRTQRGPLTAARDDDQPPRKQPPTGSWTGARRSAKHTAQGRECSTPSVAVAWPAGPACVRQPQGVPHPHTRTENRKGERVGGEANGPRWTWTPPPPPQLADRL